MLNVHGSFYVEWVGYIDHRRFIRGYLFNLFGGAISGMSKKQDEVALSTTKVDIQPPI